MITEFRKEYAFLSNFFIRDQYLPIPGYGNLVFKTNEHCFVWFKTKDVHEKAEIVNAPTPGIVKRMGGPKGYVMPDGNLFKITLREDWDEVKDQAMMAGLEMKFGQNPDLLQALIATHPQELQEGNWWGDTYWGVDFRTGKGENKLGKLLMDLRGKYVLENMPVDHKLII